MGERAVQPSTRAVIAALTCVLCVVAGCGSDDFSDCALGDLTGTWGATIGQASMYGESAAALYFEVEEAWPRSLAQSVAAVPGAQRGRGP